MMESIKKKIATLKDEIDRKNQTIEMLQNKLKLEIDEREEIEQHVKKMMADVEKAEIDLDAVDEELTEAIARLKEAEEERDIHKREVQKSENTTSITNVKLKDLAEKLQVAKRIAEDADSKYEEVVGTLVKKDADLEEAETLLEKLEAENKELTYRHNELSSNLKSYQAMESSYGHKEDHTGMKIRQLTAELDTSEEIREKSEIELDELIRKSDDLDLKIDEATEERDRVKAELQQTIEEVNDLAH